MARTEESPLRQRGAKSPYREVFDDLVRSIMRAQAEVLENPGRYDRLEAFPHGDINRHFAWLAHEYRTGQNRHLFETIYGNKPFRITGLRAPRFWQDETRAKVFSREALDLREVNRSGIPLVQQGPTRISCLIAQSFLEIRRGSHITTVDDDDEDEFPSFEQPTAGDDENYILIKSPLAIALDFLTTPEMPWSRAYVLLTLRNYLFESFNRFPSHIADFPEEGSFSVSDVEEALSHIQTSLRPRYFSAGQDKLPVKGRTAVGSLLRQYLGSRGIFLLRFKNLNNCKKFLQTSGSLFTSRVYELARSPYLDHLPELGEIVNELWGVPIPIRGADTLFRGGLKFSSRGGLVLGLHGGPGVGKTSLALAVGAVLSPFGVRTLFMTGDETANDLEGRIEALLPDDLRRRMSFFSSDRSTWLSIQSFSLDARQNVGDSLEQALKRLAGRLHESHTRQSDHPLALRPCRAVVVLDGLHDLLVSTAREKGDSQDLVRRMREFIVTCRELEALVILTTGEDWEGDKALDYIVDVALRLTHHGIEEFGKKPDRRITITKARHQLSAVGTHGVQIAGTKGVRFTPQINYQLDKRAIWKTRLPETGSVKRVLQRVISKREYDRFTTLQASGQWPKDLDAHYAIDMVRLPRGSNIYLHGEGSGGKAPLALKIAIAPAFADEELVSDREKILVVSFLYPAEYYVGLIRQLWRLRRLEYGLEAKEPRPDLKVLHLYPGHYQPDHLFNRIEWELDAAELHGRPYTAVIIDGIHNVFLQFPEIEKYSLFWPQLYAALRSRAVTIISTHSTIVLQGTEARIFHLDDSRSEPLRHALVQKTDFRFEIDPVVPEEIARKGIIGKERLANIFSVRTVSAINQAIPDRDIYWSRENLLFLDL